MRPRNTKEVKMVAQLQPFTGIKFPCRWVHNPSCHARLTLRYVAKKNGFKIRTYCEDNIALFISPKSQKEKAGI